MIDEGQSLVKEGLRTPLPASTVNLCVDMQKLFATGVWATPWLDRILPAIAAIASHHPDRTVFTRFIPPPDPLGLPGMWQRYYRRWHAVTLSELDPIFLDLVDPLAGLVPPATVIDKYVYSPFMGSRLLAHLHERRAKTLLVTGAETDVCVLATIIGAVDCGFRVVVVADAVCSSSDAGHDAMMTLFGQRFSEQIEVASTQEILDAWRP